MVAAPKWVQVVGETDYQERENSHYAYLGGVAVWSKKSKDQAKIEKGNWFIALWIAEKWIENNPNRLELRKNKTMIAAIDDPFDPDSEDQDGDDTNRLTDEEKHLIEIGKLAQKLFKLLSDT